MTNDNDSRTMITPHAFTVDSELLGVPLATPARRLAAFAIDSVVVFLLTRLGSAFFIAGLALLGFSMWRQPSMEQTVPSRWQTNVRWGLVLIVVLWGGAQVAQEWHHERVEHATTVAETTLTDESLSDHEKVLKLEHELADIKQSGDEVGVIGSFKNVLTDIGFEFGWATIYFSLLTTFFNGQTLGKKWMGTRVVQLNGKPLSIWISFNRAGGYAAGAATGMLGFAQIFWDANRQAIHDKIANTAVIDLHRSRYPLVANSTSFAPPKATIGESSP